MASYKGNIGFQEMMEVTMKADDAQMKRLDVIVNKNDLNGFRKLVFEVTGKKLEKI